MSEQGTAFDSWIMEDTPSRSSRALSGVCTPTLIAAIRWLNVLYHVRPNTRMSAMIREMRATSATFQHMISMQCVVDSCWTLATTKGYSWSTLQNQFDLLRISAIRDVEIATADYAKYWIHNEDGRCFNIYILSRPVTSAKRFSAWCTYSAFYSLLTWHFDAKLTSTR